MFAGRSLYLVYYNGREGEESMVPNNVVPLVRGPHNMDYNPTRWP